MSKFALNMVVDDKPGVLYKLAEAIYKAKGNIIQINTGDTHKGKVEMYFEIGGVKSPAKLVAQLEKMPSVHIAERVSTFSEIFGKRIIVIGGGAQVAEVATGAISEADRHNIRGEKISVDTIPLVGEDRIEDAVRAVGRLARSEVLVLAGSLMGGKITQAVKEVKEKGVLVISLNMAGSVPDVADLVITDPVQAGVVAVMAIASTAQFDINKQRGRVY